MQAEPVLHAPAGHAPARLGEWTLRQLQASLGALRLELEEAQLRNVLLQSGPQGLQAVEAESLLVRGLKLSGQWQRWPGAAGRWELEALGGLEGLLRAFIVDAAWIVDADISLVVQHGRLDFNRAEVEHVGPNSAMGISRGGVYVDAPNLGRRYLYVFTAAEVPGMHPERRERGRVADRGGLDLKALLDGLLSHGAALPGRPADPRVHAMLDRTRVAGELQCGDGLLAAPRCRVVLEGKATNRNRVGISAPALGREVVLRLADLMARDAALELPQASVSMARLSGSADLKLLMLRPRADAAPSGLRLELQMEQASVQQLKLSLRHSAAPARAAKPVRAHSA